MPLLLLPFALLLDQWLHCSANSSIVRVARCDADVKKNVNRRKKVLLLLCTTKLCNLLQIHKHKYLYKCCHSGGWRVYASTALCISSRVDIVVVGSLSLYPCISMHRLVSRACTHTHSRVLQIACGRI